MRGEAVRILLPTAVTALTALALGMHFGWDHWAVLYDTPIAWPFASFLWDRAWDARHRRADLVDALVIVTALVRSFVLVPCYSGHALFLGYVALRGTTRLTRGAAVIVLAQVVITKLVVFDDPVTLAGGLALAALAAAVRGRWRAREI